MAMRKRVLSGIRHFPSRAFLLSIPMEQKPMKLKRMHHPMNNRIIKILSLARVIHNIPILSEKGRCVKYLYGKDTGFDIAGIEKRQSFTESTQNSDKIRKIKGNLSRHT